jgi:hypothetical protein
VTLSQLRLEIGEVIQLQPLTEKAADRYAVRVIGYLPGHSLIVTAPQSRGKVLLIRDGQRFAVRMLLGESVCGYMASVLRFCSQPYPYLHLSYPTDIESIVVRNAPREPISLPAVARNTRDPQGDAHRYPVKLLDLSSTGACLASSSAFAEIGDSVELQMHLAVYDLEEDLSIVADVRNRTVHPQSGGRGNAGCRYGVQFHPLESFQKLLLYSFVLERSVSREAIE